MSKSKMLGFLKSNLMVIFIVMALSVVIASLVTHRLGAALVILVAIVVALVLQPVFTVVFGLLKEKKRQNTIKAISAITDPGERIPALERHIRKTTGPDQTYFYLQHDFSEEDKTSMKQKAALLFCLVIAHLEKGDFSAALLVCDRAMSLHPIWDEVYVDEEITYGDQCTLLVTSCLIYQRKFDEAKAAVEFLKHKEYRNHAARYRINAYLMALAINSGDTREARRLLAEVMPETIKADGLSPDYGILHELKLNEAMIDILENKYKEAQEKLDDILKHCSCNSVRKRAQQLWDEEFSKTRP